MPPINMKIKELRARNGLTLEEFSEIIKISPSYLSLIERSKRELPFKIFKKICKEFHISSEKFGEGE